jgi:3-oxoacyl-[acyl-carrier-protein] synthase III
MSSGELIWAASKEALDDAGLSIRDIDVVIAGVAPDALAGEASVEAVGHHGESASPTSASTPAA